MVQGRFYGSAFKKAMSKTIYRIAYRWDDDHQVMAERWFIEDDNIENFSEARNRLFDLVSTRFDHAKGDDKARRGIYRCRIDEVEGVFSTVIIEISCRI